MNAFCDAVSFGARATNVPRAPVRTVPCGCNALTVAWPDDNAGSARATAPALTTAAASAAPDFIRMDI